MLQKESLYRASSVSDSWQSERRRKTSVKSGRWAFATGASIVLVSLTMIRVAEMIGPIRYLKPVFSSTVLLVILHAIYTSRAIWGTVFRDTQFRLLLLYCLTVLASAPFSIWKGQTLSIVQVLPWGLGLALVVSLSNPEMPSLDRFTRLTSWICAILALLVIREGTVVEGSRITTRGTYDPNDLGALFNIFFFFALGGTLRGKVLARVLCAASAIVLLVAMMKTGSRGALVGFSIGIALFMFSFRLRVVLTTATVAVLIVPTSLPLMPPVMKERAMSLLALGEDYNTNSSSGRLYLWKRGMIFALENPIVGIGAGTFEAQIGIDFRRQNTSGAWHTAHNSYVQTFAELGLLGGGCLLMLVARGLLILQRLWSYHSLFHRPEYFSAFACYATCALFLSHGYTFIMFGMLGFTVLVANSLRVTNASLKAGNPVNRSSSALNRYASIFQLGNSVSKAREE